MISKKLDPTTRPAVDGPSLVLKAIMPAATEIQTASMSRDVASAGLRTCCVHARWTRTVNCVHQLVGYLAKRASRGAKRPARPEGRGARGSAADSAASDGPADAAAAARTLYIGNLHPFVDEAVLLVS